VKFRVSHTTRYVYREPVELASHMVHVTPRALPHQAVLSTEITATPAPARVSAGTDHFGNAVSWLFLDTPHAAFEVTANSLVEVVFPPPPEADTTPSWESVAALAAEGGARGAAAAEFSFDSPMAAADADAGKYVAGSFTPGRPLLSALLDLNGRIGRDFAFRAGVSTIHTPVSRIVAQRAGVCQDFAHMMIAGLRTLGLPARYVSGYIRTRPPPGGTRRRGADQSHAWVSCWLGDTHGWIDLDPTNDVLVQEEHVVLGWGRDYSDVSPVRGIILGGGAKHSLTVGVDLEPVETP